MASHVSSSRAHVGAHARGATKTMFVSGGTLFASVLMIFGGLLADATVIVALADDEIFTATRDYTFQFGLTGWGWTHLVLGAVITVAGFALLTRQMWARVVGVVLAGIGVVANFLWMPQYPLWAVTMLAINVAVIFALCSSLEPSREID